MPERGVYLKKMKSSLSNKALSGLLAVFASVTVFLQTGCNAIKEGDTMHNVKDFGAIGNGIANDTAAVQRAIDAGGMVYFPAGTYLCGTLFLKSDGGLYLDSGATLLASPEKKDYAVEKNSGSSAEKASDAHFIIAIKQKNITIKGPGRIDGNRQAFWEPPAEWSQTWSVKPWEWRPGQMVYIKECDNVRIQDVELYHSPYWTCFLHGCRDVIVSGVRIYNHPHTRNGDGIDIDCCRNVVVSNCIIDSGDDCITLRGSDRQLERKQPCENITVTNCVLKTICNAIRIGVGSGTIRNAVFSNCVINDSRMGISICGHYNKSVAVIENIQFDNMRINAQLPIFLLGNSDPDKPVRNISFRHIRGTASSAIRILGTPELPVTAVSFSDVRFDWLDGGKPVTKYAPFSGNASLDSPDGAVFVSYGKDITFDNCRINWKTSDMNWKFGLKTLNSKDIDQFRCNFGKENISQVISDDHYRLIIDIDAGRIDPEEGKKLLQKYPEPQTI